MSYTVREKSMPALLGLERKMEGDIYIKTQSIGISRIRDNIILLISKVKLRDFGST